MAVGKKYFDSANLLHLAMAFSMLRPELQGFVGQNTTPPMPAYPPYAQNYTGVPFAPSSTSNFNFQLAPKESGADYNNPLSEFLDWHTAGQNRFNGDGVAMLFNGVDSHAPRESRTSFSTELESGYSSDGGRSPSVLSSVAGSPLHDRESSMGNFQVPDEQFNDFGAAGYTPAEEDFLKSIGDFELDDYIDLDRFDTIYDGPPQKKSHLSEEQLLYPNIKTEPVSPVDTREVKFLNSPLDAYVPSDFIRKNPLDEISVEEPFNFDGLDQLNSYSTADSIDFIPPDEELTDTGFDFATFADNLNFANDLPLDIFDPRPPMAQTAVENKHDTLLPLGQELLPVFSEAAATRNDSGVSFTESSLSQAIGGNWESASLPLLSTSAIKQEKTDFPGPSTSTSSRFTCAKAPRDCKDARPKIASSAAASHFASEDEIIDMTISEFNTFLETLGEAQAQKARDIRRRGKNKVAARLCRKRKIEQVGDIEEDLNSLKQKKEEILNERKKLQAENAFYKNKISELQDHLFKSLRDESGRPLSPKEYSLFQGANGSIYVGKNIDSESRKKHSRGAE